MASGGAADFEINIKQIMTGQSAVTELQRTDAAIRQATASVAGYERDFARMTQKTAAAKMKTGVAEENLAIGKQARLTAADMGKLEAAVARARAKEQELASASAQCGAALEAEKAKAKALAQQYVQLDAAEKREAESAKKQAAAHKSASQDSDRLTGKLREMGGPMGQFAGMGWIGAVVALAYGFVKLAKAVVDAAVELTKFAFAAAMAESKQRLLLGGILQNEAAGVAMSKTFREIQRATGVATTDLTQMVRQLKEAKLSGKAMDDALRGLAMRQAATGESGIAKLLDDLKAGKTTAAKFSAEMDKIYGGMVGKKMSGLDEQWAEAKRRLADVFSKVDLGPLERAAARFMAVLDRPEVAAALQKGFEIVVDVLSDAVDYASRFVQWLASDESTGTLDTVWTILKGIGVVLGVAVGLLTAFVAIAATIGAPFVLVYDTIMKCVDALRQLDAAAGGSGTKGAPKMTALDIPGSPSWVAKKLMGAEGAMNDNGAKSGAALDAGTAAGVDSGGLAEAAAARLGSRTLAALDASLDAHSPSRKAMQRGRNIGEGLALGEEQSRSRVAGATNRLVQLPEQTAAKAGGGGRGAVSVGDVTITISGVPGAAEAKEEIRRVVVELLEGTAHESGAPVTEAA